MPYLQFRLNGLTKDSVYRSNNTGQSIVSMGQRRMALFVAAVAIYSLAYGPEVREVIDITGRSVLIMQDVSPSMEGKEPVRDREIKQLRSANTQAGDTLNIQGWGISAGDPRHLSFLQPLEDAVKKYSELDTVFVITDFDYTDNDHNDEEGRQRLKNLLREHNIRLYLFTVNKPPPPESPEYIDIANESGGGFLSK